MCHIYINALRHLSAYKGFSKYMKFFFIHSSNPIIFYYHCSNQDFPSFSSLVKIWCDFYLFI